MIGVGAKQKGRRDGAAVWMMRAVVGDQRRACVGCGGIVNLGKLLDPTGELT